MQREIKFRAWDKVNKRFIYFWFDGNDAICADANGKQDGTVLDDLELEWWQQFTGLKDKNGKEIYEGDIVKGWHYEDLDTGIGTQRLSEELETFPVEWDNDGPGFSMCGADDYEVIGNIYENPELLKIN